MAVASDIIASLEAAPDSSAFALLTGVETYLDVIRACLDGFGKDQEISRIYITITIPAQSIINVLKILEIDMENIYFVDAVSHTMMSGTEQLDRVYFVESPTMLENIMLKVEYLMRSVEGRKMILLDSINTLAIHNNVKILSEFLHILVNNLRAKEANTIILSVDEQTPEDILNMLNLVCDELIEVDNPE